MSQYVVGNDKLELERGTHFTTLPWFEAGDLVLFQIGDRLGIGRWMPAAAGFDWIRTPGYLICLTGEVPVRILGRIIPLEYEPREITNLTKKECAQALELARRLQ